MVLRPNSGEEYECDGVTVSLCAAIDVLPAEGLQVVLSAEAFLVVEDLKFLEGIFPSRESRGLTRTKAHTREATLD